MSSAGRGDGRRCWRRSAAAGAPRLRMEVLARGSVNPPIPHAAGIGSGAIPEAARIGATGRRGCRPSPRSRSPPRGSRRSRGASSCGTRASPGPGRPRTCTVSSIVAEPGAPMSSTAGAAPSTSAASASGSASRPSRKRIQNSKLGSPSGAPFAQPGSSGARYSSCSVMLTPGSAPPSSTSGVSSGGGSRGGSFSTSVRPSAWLEVAEGGEQAHDLAPVLEQAGLAGGRAAAGCGPPRSAPRRARRRRAAGSARKSRAGRGAACRAAARAGRRRACSRRWACRRAPSSGRSARLGRRGRRRRGRRCRRRRDARSWSPSPAQGGRGGHPCQLPVR